MWQFDTVPGPDDPAAATWGDAEALADGTVGGGSVWTVMSLDQPNELLYVPVGNPNPAFYDGDRPGENLYTNSVVVLDVRTGELQWHVKIEPRGLHNWDTSQAGPLFMARVNGEDRQLVAVTGKHGMLHLIDRDTQETLSEVAVTTIKNADEPLTADGVHVCPGYLGGVQWNGPAYNPDTGLLYVPAVDWCSVFFGDPDLPRGGGFEFDPLAQARGWVTAVDPQHGTVRWQYPSAAPMIAAVTTTAGNVVFTGSVDGHFLVLHARNGDELYRFNTGGAMAGGVVTYELDGTQYVAAVSGNQSGLWRSRGAPTVVIFGLH
jgi:alcohol dehydrogenase (cytochrome c)